MCVGAAPKEWKGAPVLTIGRLFEVNQEGHGEVNEGSSKFD